MVANNHSGNQSKETIVLKFKKRRFDGGPEVELIRKLEKKQKLARVKRVMSQFTPEVVDLNPAKKEFAEVKTSAMSNSIQDQTTCSATPGSTSDSGDQDACASDTKIAAIVKAVLMGPFEICLGVVGMCTALLGMVTFVHFKDAAMMDQSKLVMLDCFSALAKGIKDTVYAPVQVCRLLAGRA